MLNVYAVNFNNL